MNSKKLISIIITLSLATTLVACDSSKNSDKKSTNNSIKVTDEKNDTTTKTNTTNNSNDNKTNNSNDNKTNATSNTTNNTKTTNNTTSENNKTNYLNKLNSIESGLSDLDSYYAGNTIEMSYAADEEFKRWDNALNEIYNKLKEILPNDEFTKLQKEEIEWIAKKEKDANAAYDEYKGGTGKGLAYSSSVAKSTKDRCYELVNKYM